MCIRDRRITDGFVINWMNMSDGDTGQVHWESTNILPSADEEQVAHLPKVLLACNFVGREVNFSSVELINSLNVIQKVLFNGNCIEEWRFDFGFVIPGSTNTWQSTIEAAGDGKMIPAEVLSGNLVIETHFMDGDQPVCQSSLRVFYD
eukprot:TRINITY_DN10802_c0_g1_i1.p1 TRINITY_DN10802_c0_g1~~TRINITY_DN10802_c0_g1_i1.p1  ORF type:complete len:148 (+),score=40.72 TRINITY_DN10802_c0_g1_i1:161-604(+)